MNDKLGVPNVPEDEMPMVEGYYKLMGQFLLLISTEFSGPDQMLNFFNSSFDSQFKLMKPLILEDGIFDEIEESLGGPRASIIRAILE